MANVRRLSGAAPTVLVRFCVNGRVDDHSQTYDVVKTEALHQHRPTTRFHVQRERGDEVDRGNLFGSNLGRGVVGLNPKRGPALEGGRHPLFRVEAPRSEQVILCKVRVGNRAEVIAARRACDVEKRGGGRVVGRVWTRCRAVTAAGRADWPRAKRTDVVDSEGARTRCARDGFDLGHKCFLQSGAAAPVRTPRVRYAELGGSDQALSPFPLTPSARPAPPRVNLVWAFSFAFAKVVAKSGLVGRSTPSCFIVLAASVSYREHHLAFPPERVPPALPPIRSEAF